jgi:glycine cleavage system aminomethyltransferase T
VPPEFLEFWRATAWGHAKLAITDVTEAWSVIAIAGPDSREALARIVDAPAQMAVGVLKHMEFAHASYNGVPIVVLRATFSGELGFEIHCPPELALAIWQALVSGGLPPYGLEALDILRIEKGYLTHAEISGQTTPYDLGMPSLASREGDFVGRDVLARPAFHEEQRAPPGWTSGTGRPGALPGRSPDRAIRST